MGNFQAFGKGVDDFVDVLFTQAVFVAVFDEIFGRVNHKHVAAADHFGFFIVGKLGGLGVFFVNHNNAGRNARAVKQVGRQADNAFNQALFEQFGTDFGFGIATK